jgi:hypothetical protein
MPVPDFSPGEVLTAAAMDSIGMWLVASGPLATATTNFVGCFTGDFTNYRIVVDSVETSGNTDFSFRMLSGTTPASGGDYNIAMVGISDIAGAENRTQVNQSLGYTGFTNVGTFNVPIGSFVFDVYGPQIAQRTFFTINATTHTGNFIGRAGMVVHKLTTAYDGIQFLTNSAVTVGGNVTIYGYRK